MGRFPRIKLLCRSKYTYIHVMKLYVDVFKKQVISKYVYVNRLK
jgi:hypothetical protein